MQGIHSSAASAGQCVLSDLSRLSSKLEKTTFCWIGFCARDNFKHLEALDPIDNLGRAHGALSTEHRFS